MAEQEGEDWFLTCTPKDLADALLRKRFGEDESAVTNFMLEAISSLPNAASIAQNLVSSSSSTSGDNNNNSTTSSSAAVAERVVSLSAGEGGRKDIVSALLGEPLSVVLSSDASGALVENTDNNDDENTEKDGATANVSFVSPRIKMDVTWMSGGLRCVDKKGKRLRIPAQAILHVVVFPKPEDCQHALQLIKKQRQQIEQEEEDKQQEDNDNSNDDKKSSSRKRQRRLPSLQPDWVLLVLNDSNGDDDMEPVTYNGKPQTQVCFQLPKENPVWRKNQAASNPNNQEDDDDQGNGKTRPLVGSQQNRHTDQWLQVIARSLDWDVNHIIRLRRTTNGAPHSKRIFSSFQDPSTSTTTGGLPFVRCHWGLHDGVLYPLEQGLLFFKPPLFVPAHRIRAINCSTVGGGGRFVELVVTLKQNKDPNNEDDANDNDNNEKTKYKDDQQTKVEHVQFTNINAAEHDVLESYIDAMNFNKLNEDDDDNDQNDENESDSKDGNDNDNKKPKADDEETDDEDDADYAAPATDEDEGEDDDEDEEDSEAAAESDDEEDSESDDRPKKKRRRRR